MRSAHWLVVLALAAAGAGCASREHLAEGYGRSYHAAFVRQSIRNRDQSVPPVTGLDSQEATLISDKYRRSLAAKGETQDEGSVLYIAPPPTNSNRAMMPPPSVPKDQR